MIRQNLMIWRGLLGLADAALEKDGFFFENFFSAMGFQTDFTVNFFILFNKSNALWF